MVKKNGELRSSSRTKTGLWETGQAYLRAPWQAGPDVVIKKREEARNIYDTIQHSQTLKIYTYGSEYQGHVGSTAVVPDLNTFFTAHLGTESISTVYAAELKGMQMALAMVKRVVQAGANRWKERAARGIHIFSNSQAGFKALINPWIVSGQVFLKACPELKGWCSEAGFHVVFHWIPAHYGIDGNKKADKLAKAAAVRGPIPDEAKQMVRLRAAAKRVVRKRLKKVWVQAWKKKKTSRPTKHLTQAPGQACRSCGTGRDCEKQPPQSSYRCALGV
jgi:ribonuclease HI